MLAASASLTWISLSAATPTASDQDYGGLRDLELVGTGGCAFFLVLACTDTDLLWVVVEGCLQQQHASGLCCKDYGW